MSNLSYDLLDKWKEVCLRDQSMLLLRKKERISTWQLIEQMNISEKLKQKHLNFSGPNTLLDYIGQRHRVELWNLPRLNVKSLTWDYPRIAGWIESLMGISSEIHKDILSKITEWDGKYRDEYRIFDFFNAIDHHYISTLLPQCQNFMDYGGGYGRQVFLPMKMMTSVKFFVTDVIERFYLMQTWTFSKLKYPFLEYMTRSEIREEELLDFAETNEKCIAHIPTWRTDLIPKSWFDCIIFVWSINEMSNASALHALDTAIRVLKPGGYVYIRDDCSMEINKIDVEKYLIDHHFDIVYNPRIEHMSEGIGVLRLFKKKG